MRLFHNTNYNFLRWRWHAVALSWVVILAGVGVMYTKGIPRGIEFAGGTSIIAQFDSVPSVQAVRDALNANYPGGGQNAVVQAYGAPAQRQIMANNCQLAGFCGRMNPVNWKSSAQTGREVEKYLVVASVPSW